MTTFGLDAEALARLEAEAAAEFEEGEELRALGRAA